LKSIGQQIKILERLQHISDRWTNGRTNGRTNGISISPAPLCEGGGQKNSAELRCSRRVAVPAPLVALVMLL